VPESDSTGGKVKQNGLSKKVGRSLRSLLVNGAMLAVRHAGIVPLGWRSCSPACRPSSSNRDCQQDRTDAWVIMSTDASTDPPAFSLGAVRSLGAPCVVLA